MKLLDIERLRAQGDDSLQSQPWWPALLNSITDLMARYPSPMTDEERDLIFQRENRCEIGYAPNSIHVKHILFREEKDWTYFVLKWL